jgi:hypothetical protein
MLVVENVVMFDSRLCARNAKVNKTQRDKGAQSHGPLHIRHQCIITNLGAFSKARARRHSPDFKDGFGDCSFFT